MTAREPDFQPGSMLPGTKYRVVKPLGAGGMGIVYQVVKAPEIQGVLKLMSDELAAHEEFRTRFFDEVRVLAQLDHPNIVRVFDYDSLADGTPYYVMELLHGRTVRDVLATMGAIPPRVAFEISRQLCEALHCAHTNDIPVVHRDIKPENIFLHAPRHGEPVLKLIDFGVVSVADRQHDGTFVGTWKYAAPEQIRGERATAATDIYAVGLVLYEMLCGMGPFEHCESGELVGHAHLHDEPPPVSKFAPWVPRSIVELIEASLAKDPSKRPPSAYAFAERLFELEWANDGNDPHDRTSEGPLSRVLSTIGKRASSRKMAAAVPAKDRLGNVPLIGVPPSARHDGPTLRGMGNTAEPTSPGEDALLAGLVARPDLRPRSKKERESDPTLEGAEKVIIRPGSAGVRIEGSPAPPRASGPRVDVTIDAPASEPSLQKNEADTFASQASDTRTSTARARGGRMAIPLGVAALALVGGASVVVLRGRATETVKSGSAANVVVDRAEVTSSAAVTTSEATTPPAPPVETSASSSAVAATATATAFPQRRTRTADKPPPVPPSPASARPSSPVNSAATAPTSAPTPKPANTDGSFIRDFGGGSKP